MSVIASREAMSAHARMESLTEWEALKAAMPRYKILTSKIRDAESRERMHWAGITIDSFIEIEEYTKDAEDFITPLIEAYVKAGGSSKSAYDLCWQEGGMLL